MAACPAHLPVDDAGEGDARSATLPRMSIEMHAAEVYRLADTLRGAGRDAAEIESRLRDSPSLRPSTLQAAAETFLESHRAAGRAFAGELAWLGDTVSAVADSWLLLDRSLLEPDERPRGT